MSIRRQFVLDKKTNRLLEELAADAGGNRSLIIREAVRAYAEREGYFQRIESDPEFIAMMEESERAFREGRVTPHEEVVRMSRAKRRGKR